MTEPTIKQIKFARELGIENPENFDKQQLSVEIDKRVGGSKKPQLPKGQKSTETEQVVLTKVEKPNSYEFGKAGQRHKIYYDEVFELKDKIEQLKEAGLYQEYEEEKIN